MGNIVISKGEVIVTTFSHDEFLENGGTFDISFLPFFLPFKDQTIREANGGRGITVSHDARRPSGNLFITGVYNSHLVEGGRPQNIVVSPIAHGFLDSVSRQIVTGYTVRHETS